MPSAQENGGHDEACRPFGAAVKRDGPEPGVRPTGGTVIKEESRQTSIQRFKRYDGDREEIKSGEYDREIHGAYGR